MIVDDDKFQTNVFEHLLVGFARECRESSSYSGNTGHQVVVFSIENYAQILNTGYMFRYRVWSKVNTGVYKSSGTPIHLKPHFYRIFSEA